ncbi:MAG: hypothetical protein WA821_10175 [Anaerolineales bacterium]
MHSRPTYRRYLWIILLALLVGCGPVVAPVTVPTAIAVATPTKVDMNAFSTQIAGTVVAQITQTAYVTSTQTRPPTGTPQPTRTPLPVYAPGGKLKVSIIDGNLYIQNGGGQNVQLTHSKADHDPFFSDDGKKVIFYRGYADNNNTLYSIDANGGQEQQIIDISVLAVQDGGQIKALTFIKNTHILLFNIYICGKQPEDYPFADCFVSTYSVNADSGETKEIGQKVSGFSADEHNFELSPNRQYVSIAGSGHINVFSFSSGHFKLAYFGAFAYSMTRAYEFLPYQYWLPDSSGLIIVSAAAGTSNGPPDPPNFYDIFRYTLGKKAVQIKFDAYPSLGDAWRMGCVVSISPDRNWIFFVGNKPGDPREEPAHLGNLNNGRTQVYDFLGDAPCSSIEWSPDSKHFAESNLQYGLIGSVDGGPLITIKGSFEGWIDATHYSYSVEDSKTYKFYTAEIGEDPLLLPSPTPTPTPTP